MHFGRNDIDFSSLGYHLPADTSLTTATLQSTQPTTLFKGYVGAPKWAHKHWLGKIYPKGTKESDFLAHYAMAFNAVEFSSTFYQPQPPERMALWKQMVDAVPDFRFCPKFPQSITHIRRFRNVEQQTNDFYTSIAVLGKHLGPIFLQLADNFTPNTFADLKAYLATLPVDAPLFLEVRNKNWFAVPEHRYKLFDTLSELKIGAVIADTAGRRDCLHMELPTPHAFIRFVNSGDEQTDFMRLNEWVKRLKIWKDKGLQSFYFFIHAGDTPSLSLFDYIIPMLNEELDLNLKIPGNSFL